ncbi:exocyst complex component 3-like protein 4 isoform X2 [Hyperolius riggenbachi]|uniref:exocyst complex component 3-like protein 4 isoform X2 n=1 Tax=Hyperolius riggenbachi TaxID=752182 RepID=UPI0035A2BE0E
MESSSSEQYTGNPFDEPDSKPEEKKPGLLKGLGSLKKSRRSSKKVNETEETSSPEKKESPSGHGLSFNGIKKALRRQSQVEEPTSPDKKEPFGALGARLSKIYHKKDDKKKEEESKSPEKESPGASGFLVGKLRSTVKAKKKIDFNEKEEDNNNTEGPGQQEEKVDVADEPLSVMEINGLIEKRELQKAFRHIKFREDKLIVVYQSQDIYENITELTNGAKDVDLLYGSLFNKMRAIVKETLHQDPVDENLVASLVGVIETEAISHANPSVTSGTSEIVLGQPRRWRHLWKEAVKDSVAKRVESVPLYLTEEGWLPNHLEKLRLTTVEDLAKVKNTFMSLYPENFSVCSTYLQSFHDSLSSHLQRNIVPQALQFSQLYSLLDWILNTYKSEKFMGSPELQPEMKAAASLHPPLEGESLEKLKRAYEAALQETVERYLNNILDMEKRKWEDEKEVEEETLEDTAHLPLFIDTEIIGSHVRESAKLSQELETSAIQICVEHLGSFSTRLQEAFIAWSGNQFTAVSVQYSVLYINSLVRLRHNTTQSDEEPFLEARSSLEAATDKLKQHLFHLFSKETKPQFQKLITKSWLNNGTEFSVIMKSAKILCPYVKHLISPHNTEVACRVHKYMVKEYIAQIMKRRLSLNALNRKRAAHKMKEEGDMISDAAEKMGSDRKRMNGIVKCLAEIIECRKKDEIMTLLSHLYIDCPDISEEHILCILHLHGMGRSKKILDHLEKLQEHPVEEERDRLFSEIDCVAHVACIPCRLLA